MKVVKYLLPAFAMLLTVPAFAEDNNNLTVSTGDGESKYDISQVKTLVFTESAMQVKLADGTVSPDFPYANLSKVYFSGESDGTVAVELGDVKVAMDAERNNLIVNGDIKGDVNIYNLSGMKVITKTNCDGYIFIGDLAEGIYVLEINNKAIKFKK